MSGRGPAPKVSGQRTRHARIRGDWTPAIGIGWQFEPFPQPPDGLLEASRAAWETWFRAWFAAHWTPDDLPGLRQLIRVYDQLERGAFQRASELRLGMDGYGITPKGQQDRRWKRPDGDTGSGDGANSPAKPKSPYAHLRVVDTG